MIDTDKYEGHTEGPWKHNDKWGLIKYGQIEIAALHSGNSANAKLIADAPLLLAFYNRIKEIMDMDEIEEIQRVELILQEMIE